MWCGFGSRRPGNPLAARRGQQRQVQASTEACGCACLAEAHSPSQTDQPMLAGLTEHRQTPKSVLCRRARASMPVQADLPYLTRSGNHIGNPSCCVPGSFHLGFRTRLGRSQSCPCHAANWQVGSRNGIARRISPEKQESAPAVGSSSPDWQPGTPCSTGLFRASWWRCRRSGLLFSLVPWVLARVNAKSRSGQGGGQDPGVASNPVAQQPNGHMRTEILLNRAHPVQGGPSEDAHHGRPVSRVQAAVVLPELHVQGAVQAVLHAPVAADQLQQGRLPWPSPSPAGATRRR